MWDATIDRLLPGFAVFALTFALAHPVALLVQHESVSVIAAAAAALATIAALVARRV